MTNIRHRNVIDADGQIYCCLRNKVVTFDTEHQNTYCSGCKMKAEEPRGGIVTCEWEDLRPVADPCVVTDPQAEWKSNQKRQIVAPPFMLESHGDLNDDAVNC
ncbi:hypothetical protein [Paenibacillus cymbidii]|uniref:hypothetical protein n=1 Tax=Paenibacillus cymbidii TaxID=1639034 RepID=UPI001081BCAF|nr:hypothetical protein [Paenibacillus cymbidii]